MRRDGERQRKRGREGKVRRMKEGEWGREGERDDIVFDSTRKSF
jgi:hypothetical protein